MNVGFSIKIALVAAALFLVIGNVFIIYKNYDTEWRRYQKEYLGLVYEKTTDPQMREILRSRAPRSLKESVDLILLQRLFHTLFPSGVLPFLAP